MEITTTTVNRNPGRRAAVNALAFVGFVALIIIGILLAIYLTRMIPGVSSLDGGAGVSLSSIFKDADEEPQLQVVTPNNTSDSGVLQDLPPVFEEEPAQPAKPAAVTPKPSTGYSYPTGYTTVRTVVTSKPQPYGKSDLSVRITDVGYTRRNGDTDSFVRSDEVDRNKDGAVRFVVTNVGTGNSGSWKFEAELPSSPSRTFTSPTQRSLGPGDSIEFVLGFEEPRSGDNRRISIEVDPTDRIDESNERNNEATRSVDVD